MDADDFIALSCERGLFPVVDVRYLVVRSSSEWKVSAKKRIRHPVRQLSSIIQKGNGIVSVFVDREETCRTDHSVSKRVPWHRLHLTRFEEFPKEYLMD